MTKNRTLPLVECAIMIALSLSKKSSNGWAFLRLYDKMVLGDERCWNAEKWIVVS